MEAEEEGVCKGYFDSPVGVYELQADVDGVTSIKLIPESEKPANYNSNDSRTTNQHITDCSQWMETYFQQPKKISKCRMPILNTSKFKHKTFCRKVWKLVSEHVGPGQTLTYGEVAKLAGNPNAARAVGMAMKSNPLSIIMPCHRVVSKGGLGYYSSLNGIETKKWLLQHEMVDLKKLQSK